jgi:hypothetical protein
LKIHRHKKLQSRKKKKLLNLQEKNRFFSNNRSNGGQCGRKNKKKKKKRRREKTTTTEKKEEKAKERERGEKGEMRAAAVLPPCSDTWGLIHPFSSPVSSISSRPPGLIYSASSSQFPFAVRKKRRLHNKRCLA